MLLLQQMVIFFLIMLIGYICRKVGVFGENTGKMISGIVINIGNPALIIASGMNPETLENKAALLVTLAVALIFFAIMFVIAELIPRLLRADREDYGSYQVMTIFANIGFMGYPLLEDVYKRQGYGGRKGWEIPKAHLRQGDGILKISIVPRQRKRI